MTTLILVICLAGAPDVCREERAPIEGISCVMQGQQIAARWIDEHPKYILRGWRCGRPETKA